MMKQAAIVLSVLALAQLGLAASSRFFLTNNGRELAFSGARENGKCAAGCDNLNMRLRRAAIAGDAAGIKSLIERGADANTASSAGATPVYLAALHGNLLAVKQLVASGARVVDFDAGYDALSIAVSKGHAKIVSFLADAGANVDVTDSLSGRTPLMTACAKGYPAVVEALLAAGADLNAQDFFGRTALIFAISYGEATIAVSLIEAGADVDIKSEEEITPLMAAAAEGQLSVVQRLLSAGAEKAVMNIKGETALSLAQHKGHMMIASLLKPDTPAFG